MMLPPPLDSASTRSGSIVFITGEPGAGKTTWCAAVIDVVRRMGWSVRGLISPAVIENGEKIGIDVVDVFTGERRRLANRRSTGAQGIVTQRWLFEPEIVAWSNAQLSDVPPCDLLTIDEIGPLELERQEGWQNALSALDARRFRVACVVIRASLVSAALERWPDGMVHRIGADHDVLPNLG